MRGPILAGAMAIMAATGSAAALQGGAVVRLTIDPQQQTIEQGGTAQFTIGLKDSQGRPVKPPQDIPVQVEATLPSRRVQTVNVTLSKDQASVPAALTLDEAGLALIRAKSPQTLEGGASVYVRNPGRGSADMDPPSGALSLRLALVPGGGIVANGIDSGRVIVALAEGEAPVDIKLTFITDLGQFDRQHVVLQRHTPMVETRITSKQAGEATVGLLNASVDVRLEPDVLRVRFLPAIQGFRYLPTGPVNINLVQTLPFTIELYQNEGLPIKTDEDKEFRLYLRKGHGGFDNDKVKIPKDESATTATFIPTGLGIAVVCANSDVMLPGILQIHVGFPWLSLVQMVAGGLLGGLLFCLVKRGSWWRDPVIGAICGFVTYWAVLFGVTNLVPLLSQGLTPTKTLNPFSAVAIGIVGGALGPWWLWRSKPKSGTESDGPA